ncbi:MAG: hypothetical protein JJE51_09370 [Thermoanaerobaculia bacterium]|nr:hypothetical protein [Thermoanaerobaculia bacterium]
MAVRGEEVASSIDSHVKETIVRMVAEIRSSIEDVRAAVDSQLNAALQSLQADVNAITFLPHLKKVIGEMAAAAPPPPPPVAAPSGSDARKLKKALQSVERGKSQVDVLNALLEQSLEFGSRAALLILRGETFSGWKGAGFSSHGGNDESIKRFNAAPGLIAELDQVLRQERVVDWNGENLASRFGVGPSARAILVPMVIKDKVAAAVYVDAVEGETSKLDRASIEILVFTTGLLVDTLAIRKKIPSPALSGESAAAMSAPSHPPAAPRPAFAPAPMSFGPSPPNSESTVAFNAVQMRDLVAAATPAAVPKPAAPPPPAAPKPVAHEERVSTQYVPPSGIGRPSAASGQGSEDSKKHDEARRFARLLVSEIKLYNEPKVEQGRRSRDLYQRMKEDIDRSRQMYDERIGEDVRKGSNYFYDELVRILADGNADSLGL